MAWIYLTGICIAFSLAVILTAGVRRLALAVGAMDVPDGQRKLHQQPTPRLGGVAVAAAFFVALFALPIVFPTMETSGGSKFLLPCAAILAVGIWDDVRAMKPRLKLLLQCVAAACFYWAGFRLERVFGMGLPMAVSLPASILWLVACANAVNLFDGMDGLASGLGVVMSVALLSLSAYQGKTEVAVISAALAGACAGFLLFNLPPAVIFLGDSGSLFLGMTLGALAVEGSFKSHLAFALIVPVIALGLPIMDTVMAITRRVSRRVPIFSADKDHIHQRLMALGFTKRQALVLLYGLCVLLASFSLLIAFSGSVLAGVLAVAAGVVIAVVARLIGASDFKEFGFFVIGGLGRHRAVSRYRKLLKNEARALEKETSGEAILSKAVRDLRSVGLDFVHAQWDGSTATDGAEPSPEEAPDVWRWDTRLGTNGVFRGSLIIVKRGGPKDMPPELPLLVSRYAASLEGALAHLTVKGQGKEASL
jgi:UDP-GlcNAc:undecaprenyl-phosphate GlcNAc-1-phosphate transferase